MQRLLKPKQVAEILNVSVRTLANRRALGLEPAYIQDKKGSTVRYPDHLLDNFIQNKIKNNSKFKRGRNND
jgi:hypothetical protein